MKKRYSTLYKLFSGFSWVLAVIAAVSVSFAWLSTNNQASDSGLNMQIDADTISAMPMTTYWKHLVDETLTYEKSTGAQITLPTYDSVFEELNDNCEIFLRVPVIGKTVNAGEDFTITLSIKDMYEGKTGSAENMNHYEYDENGELIADTVALYLSNVVSVSCGLIPGLNDTRDTTIEGVQTIVDDASEFFSTGGDKEPFDKETFLFSETVDDKTVFNKVDKIEFTLSGYSGDRLLVDEGERIYLVYIYFRITYEPNLINNLMEHHELAIGNQQYEINSDFDKFVLSIE